MDKTKFDIAVKELELAISSLAADRARPFNEADADRVERALDAVGEALKALRTEM